MRLMQAVDAERKSLSPAWTPGRVSGRLFPAGKLIAWLRGPRISSRCGAEIYAWVARNRYRWNRETLRDGSCHSPLWSLATPIPNALPSPQLKERLLLPFL